MTEVLGERLMVAGWALRGILPPERMVKVLREAVARMNMTADGLEPVIKQFPLPSGQGGIGHTIYLPLGEPRRLSLRVRLGLWLLRRTRFANTVFQPLVESFIISDDYVVLNKTCILAASCLPFSQQALEEYLAEQIGPVIARGDFPL
jgi:hypothetical protein